MDASAVVEDILAHHGIKGMHWGIRRDRSGKVTVSNKRIGKGLKTTGGFGHPAHADAVRTAKLRRIGQKSGVKALSDEELKAYTTRLNLEQNAKRLTFESSNPAKKFVLKLIGQSGKTAAQNAANEAASQQVKKHLIRAGMVAAAA